MHMKNIIYAAGVWLLSLVLPSCGQNGNMDRRDTVSLGKSVAYLDRSKNTFIRINSTVDLTSQIAFSISFRTCSYGQLLYQQGQGGDWFSLSLDQKGALVFSWWQNSTKTAASSKDSGSVVLDSKKDESSKNAENSPEKSSSMRGFAHNQWFTADVQYLQGVMTLAVEQGSQKRYHVLLSNSTFRRNLWDLKLRDGGPLVVGQNFTGCLQEGLGVMLSSNATDSDNIQWNTCPLETQRGCAEDGPDPCYSFPCKNGGSCQRSAVNFTCNCPLPYSGEKCELDLGDKGCDLTPCQNGGSCSPRTTGTRRYECECPAGFTGVNCEIEILECASLPCQNGGKCQDQVNGYSCNCTDTGYKGTLCETNINECTEAPPCAKGAMCMDTPGSFRCQCPVGFAGRTCEMKIEECASQPCQNNGSCAEHLGYYLCSCSVGFTGLNCEVNIDDCLPTACPDKNSECVDGVNTFECVCKPGFSGKPGSCADIDECASAPCVNGGTCINGGDRYNCSCVPGYVGVNCETDVNECESDPCQNGARCRDLVDSFGCVCLPGYTGPSCETNIYECDSAPCKNNATCVDLIDGFNCSCASGWEGRLCQFNIDECMSDPCQNGGKCADLVDGYNCTCVAGYQGVHCESNIDDCKSTPCLNGATCHDLVDGFKCDCNSTWMGDTCATIYNACSLKPCKNGATCSTVAPSRNYTCMCPSGFKGKDCEINIDDCVGHTCLDYQVCVDGVNEYNCSCPPGYTGATCDQEINECDSSPCRNGGTCLDEVGAYKCHCPGSTVNLTRYTSNPSSVFNTGYKGDNCEIPIDECSYDPPICLNNGLCENTDSGFSCLCRNSGGFYNVGVYCEKKKEYCDIVEENDKCRNGAKCKSFVDGFECICAPGYKGPRCEVEIDECLSNPCQYEGNCTDKVNGYTCSCVAGVTGANCEVNINECDSNPCQNGGKCTDMVNSTLDSSVDDSDIFRWYECNCTDTGFTGELCQININECESSPCQHGGNCTDLIKNFRCDCHLGYTGKMCETDILECESSPCMNGATCRERSTLKDLPSFIYGNAHGYDCACVPGYTGTNCGTNIDECASNPCKFGTCIDGVNKYTCKCTPGYKGVNCETEIDECALYKPCEHGGTCVDRVNDYECDCIEIDTQKVRYGGKNCSIELTGCSIHACQNGAKCIPYLSNEIYQIHNYTCKCLLGYTDFYCQTSTTMSLKGSGYVKIPVSDTRLYVNRTFINFSFRTTLPDGMLFVIEGATPTESLTVALEGGNRLLLVYLSPLEQAQGTLISPPNTTFNNSYWQDVEIHVNEVEGVVLLLNQTMSTHSSNKIVAPFAFQNFLIGGEMLGQNTRFTGCMRELHLGGTIIKPGDYLKDAVGMSVNCPRVDQCHNPDPCHGNGLCEDLWTSHRCYCRRPYLEPNCDKSYTAATFGQNGNSSMAKLDISPKRAETLKTSVKISLFLRTREKDGLVFYLGDNMDSSGPLNLTYIATVIANGSLLVLVKLRPENQVFPFNFPNISDGQQHLIQLHWERKSLDLWVDDVHQNYTIDFQLELTAAYIQFGMMKGQPSGSRRKKRQAPGPTATEKMEPTSVGSTSVGSTSVGPTSVGTTLVGSTSVEPTSVGPTTAEPTSVRPTSVEPTSARPTPTGPTSTGPTPAGPTPAGPTQAGPTPAGPTPAGPTPARPTPARPTPARPTPARPTPARPTPAGPEEPLKPWDAGSFKGTIQDFRLGDIPVQFYPINGTNNNPVTLIVNNMTNVKEGEITDEVCLLHSPCVNNSTCVDVFFNDYKCKCPVGFWGKNCSSIDYCVSTTCPGEETKCINKDDGFECVSTATFDGLTSMVTYQNDQTQNMTSLKATFRWRSRKANGTILHIGTSQHYVTIGMSRGYLEVRYNLADRDMNISIFPFQIDTADAVWNEGEFIFSEQDISYKVNKKGFKTPEVSYRTSKQNHGLPSLLQLGNKVFVGGVEQGYLKQNAHMFMNADFFKGCLSEVRIGGRLLPFFSNQQLGEKASAKQFAVTSAVSIRDGCHGDPVCEMGYCVNNSTCDDIFNAYLCNCAPGFNGTKCEVNIDDCFLGACYNNGTCVDGIQDYSCNCLPGYTGKQCQTEIDECASSPCQNNATCFDLLNGFFCNCSANYTGKFCQVALTDNCDTQPCENNGTCIQVNATENSLVSFNCSCQPGFTGLRCENEIDYCDGSPCKNGATCMSHTDQQKYTCSCAPGYTSSDCEVDINECDSTPCQNNATCSNLIGQYECNCTTGWSGDNCDEDIDECNLTSRPCNKGKCINNEGSYFCNCSDTGYAGPHCETQIDECNLPENPCQNNSTCYDTDGSYQCNCTLGYEGQHCEIANCSHGQCFNGSDCQIRNSTSTPPPPILVTQWFCVCPQFYEGDRCETKGPCVDGPCENNGTCSQSGTEYSCKCPAGWEGKNCSDDIDECASSPCQFGATCNNLNGSYECLCVPGYSGQNCESNIDECESQPCQNGATCLDDINSFRCSCAPGYTGNLCESDIDECLLEPCQYNGTCINSNGGYHCNCVEGYLGVDCEIRNPCYESQRCENGGTCEFNNATDYECRCPPAYEGAHCEKAVPQGGDLNVVALAVGLSLTILILLIIIGIIAFVIVAKNKRATRGTYSPSRQEMSGSRVEMGNVLKPPPEERLI